MQLLLRWWNRTKILRTTVCLPRGLTPPRCLVGLRRGSGIASEVGEGRHQVREERVRSLQRVKAVRLLGVRGLREYEDLALLLPNRNLDDIGAISGHPPSGVVVYDELNGGLHQGEHRRATRRPYHPEGGDLRQDYAGNQRD